MCATWRGTCCASCWRTTAENAAVSSRIERVEPVLNVRDVAAATSFYARLGFVEQFRDDPDSPRFVIVRRDDAVLALQWHDFVGIAGDRPTLRAFIPAATRPSGRA